MANTNLDLVKIFIKSSIGSTILLLIACFLWTEFELAEVANIMFWVGAFVMIIGVGFFYQNNPYNGQSEVSMTLLKDKPYGKNSLERNDSETTQRFKRGACVALPGIFLIIASWLILTR